MAKSKTFQPLRKNAPGRRPWAPMRLYHCSGDRTVPFTNSVLARNQFHTNGARHVLLVDPLPGADHGAGAVPCFLTAKQWLDSLKQ